MNVRMARLTTTVLGGTCAVLLLIALAQYAGLGRGYRWSPDDPSTSPVLPGAAVDEKPLQLPPESAFAEIDAHPLFNEDRQPTPADASDDTAEAEAPQNPLNVALTGIVSTANVKVAMVRDKARNQSMALKVGMPLEGDQAGWTLVEVKPRSVVFESAASERTEIELETSVAPLPPPRMASHGNSRPQPHNASTPREKANELAKRIEDRRRQMREDAERLKKEKAAHGRPEPHRK